MTARILDGKGIAEAIRGEIRQEVQALRAAGFDQPPALAVILVGDHPASAAYVLAKTRACAESGIAAETYALPRATSEAEVLALIDRLNADPSVHAILPQLPLPDQIDPDRVVEAILPEKDADGLHPENLGRLLRGQPALRPCTPAGIQELLHRSGIDPTGRHVVVVGCSTLVGKPLALLLAEGSSWGNATVTLCHRWTANLAYHTWQADILVAAAGLPGLIRGDMIRPGTVVIDVGITRLLDPSRARGYRLVGDVDFAAARQVAGAITPVPGGVGPMTVAMLLANTVACARRQLGAPASLADPVASAAAR